MIRHILKIMWNQRRSNGWIFAELAVVAAVLWMMIDTSWVDYRTYHAPLGFDIGNVWRFKLSDLDAKAPGYVPDSLYHSSDPEDLTRLMTQIRQNPEVEDVCVNFLFLSLFERQFLEGSQAGGWRHDLCGPYGVVPNAQCHTGIFPPFPYPDGRRRTGLRQGCRTA